MNTLFDLLYVLKNVRQDIMGEIAAEYANIQHLEKSVLMSVLVRKVCVTSCLDVQIASIPFLFYLLFIFCQILFNTKCKLVCLVNFVIFMLMN